MGVDPQRNKCIFSRCLSKKKFVYPWSIIRKILIEIKRLNIFKLL